MRLVLATALALGCGAPPPSRAPIANRSPGAVPAEPVCAPGLSGRVIDGKREPVIGATLVATKLALRHDEKLALVLGNTDGDGRFALSGLDRFDKLTVYYDEAIFEGPVPGGCEAVVAAIGVKGPPGEAAPLMITRQRRW